MQLPNGSAPIEEMVIPDVAYLTIVHCNYQIDVDKKNRKVWLKFSMGYLPFIKIQIPMDSIPFAKFISDLQRAQRSFDEIEADTPA